jgi:hypothetical protein
MMVDPSRLQRGRLIYEEGDLSTERETRLRRGRLVYGGGETLLGTGRLFYGRGDFSTKGETLLRMGILISFDDGIQLLKVVR